MHAHEHTDGDENEQGRVDEKRACAECSGAAAIEPGHEQRTMESHDRSAGCCDQDARDGEIGARHSEQVAEEEALEPRRGARREREHYAEAEERRDHDRDASVPLDEWYPCDERNRDRGHENAHDAARKEREPQQGGDDEARKESVRERLRAVGELVQEHPAADETADDTEKQQLEERPAHERLRERMEQRVGHQW